MNDTQYRLLHVGEPAPNFTQNTDTNPTYVFDSSAGRYLVLCFYSTSRDEGGKEALATIAKHRKLFDDEKIALFGVSVDPDDKASGRAQDSIPGIRHFWDFDFHVSRLYGAAPSEMPADRQLRMQRSWVVIDPNMRIRHIIPFNDGDCNAHEVIKYLKNLPPVKTYVGFEVPVPVIVLPNVFEPEFCAHLIDQYEQSGGMDSGFMREIDGKTVEVKDYGHKRRSDFIVENEALVGVIQQKVLRRIVPEIKKVHQYDVTRMERYLVGCYDSETGGHFRAHRDNTTRGTAHRRFAVSINLNRDFEGGEISFPEYGPRSFKPPVGGAVIFSCSLLHAVSPVTKGKRYAFLPFLYDDAAAGIREANVRYLAEGSEYTANQAK